MFRFSIVRLASETSRKEKGMSDLSDAGYLLRYRQDAAAQGILNWNRLRIMRFKDSDTALVYKSSMLPPSRYPELPKTFPNYESAFAFAEELLRRETALSADKEEV